MVIRATRSLAICKAKAVYVISFLSHFKIVNVGPVPGTEPSTSRSAVKRFTNWANPAAEPKKSPFSVKDGVYVWTVPKPTKNYLPHFPTQKNPGIEYFKPQKIHPSALSLKIRRNPTGYWVRSL